MAAQDAYCRLAYDPSLQDDGPLSQSAYNYYVPINKTLARNPITSQLYFHGNSRVRALENSADVSKGYGYMLLRLRRQWEGRLSARTQGVEGNYELLTRSDGPLGFGWDYNLDPAKTWLDAPGTIDHPKKTNYRYLQEFVIFAAI